MLVAVGALLCSLPLTGTSLVQEVRAGAPLPEVTADVRLVKRSCGGFSPRDVLRGRAGRQGPTCRPIGIDGGVVRSPIAKAAKRDRRNYGRRVHGHRHTGTDFRARCGAAVRASHGGKVVIRKTGRRGPRTVGVSTGPRRLTTWYGPVRAVRVRNGAVVGTGRQLGRVAKVKRSRCHLHFVVSLRAGARDPLRVNPSRWLRRNGGRHVSGMSPGDRRAGVFVAASLNVLGHSHTARGGKHRKRFAGSGRRMHLAISLLKSNHVSLVGLQELQGGQRKMFLRRTKGWRIHSPASDPQDSIAWRSSRFRLVRTGAFRIPYFRTPRPMPVVVLRDRATGRKLVIISVHNPRGSSRKMRKHRSVAVSREVRKVRALARADRAPVILMGDFNDRSRKLFCRVTRHGLKASSGGIRGRHCRPSQAAGIDWIFGTRKIRFLAHQRVLGGLVARTTDHPLVLARVRR
jgi:endonuclease/exonuclease/phosphatase family metal-dependent hydrolase